MNSVDSDISVYVPMSDGVQLAVDVWLPKRATNDDRFPVMVEFTRYWRHVENRGPRDRILYFPKMGFAHAVVDCRGSGASFGVRHSEQSVEEIKDFPSLINWLAEQPWSNGAVVSIGSSYSGNTAEFAMIDAPVALKASICRFSDFDTFAHLFFPGGLLNKIFLDPWGAGVYALDINCVDDSIHSEWNKYRNASVKPVALDANRKFLNAAVLGHQDNLPICRMMSHIEFRDDFDFASEIGQLHTQWVSPHLMQKNEKLSQLPSYHWASFNDAGTAAGAIARFMGSKAPMRVVIGYWSHGAELDTNPFRPDNQIASPTFEAQFSHIAKCLKALKLHHPSNKLRELSGRNLYYFTAGQNVWKRTDVWPPRGVSAERWYFSDNKRLTLDQPRSKDGKDIYRVDFDVGTGMENRWNQLVPEVRYGDRSGIDRRLLTYTSDPLTHSIEITGHPVIHLIMSSTRTDGAVIVYLEDVSPSGFVTMLTEGAMRLIHRKVSNETPSYPVYGPYHSFERKDAMLMDKSQSVYVGFELMPLSVEVKKGHALRVAIAGHDKDSFQRVPKKGSQTYQFHRHLGSLSYIDLPIRGSKEGNYEGLVVDPFL